MKRMAYLLITGCILFIQTLAQSYQPLEDQRLSVANSVAFQDIISKGQFYHHNSISVLNKAGTDWINWAIRNTATSDSKIDLSNILSLNGGTPIHSGNINSYVPTLTGSGASGNWNISAARWGGIEADYSSGYGSNLVWMPGFDASLNKIKPMQAAEMKNFLGLPTMGETLQSVTERGSGFAGYLQSARTGGTTYYLNSTGANYRTIQNDGPNVWSLGYSTINNGILGTSVISWGGSGNVGIGTIFPAYKLDVNGGLRAMDNVAIKKENVDNGLEFQTEAMGSYLNIQSSNSSFNVPKNLSLNAYGGNVGIGTTQPSRRLEVISENNGIGPLLVKGTNGSLIIDNIGYGENYYAASAGHFFQDNNNNIRVVIRPEGNVGIGTTAPSHKLDVNGSGRFGEHAIIGTGIPQGFFQDDTNGGYRAKNNWDNGFFFSGYGGSSTTMFVGLNGSLAGKVGIGTTNPQSELSVKGTITSKKVKVTLEGWADYVFDSSYQLAPLHQVEKFIQANKHLPEVPSAAEVKKEGLDLGDNQAVLLKKIEELTLYIIQQNKELSEQNKKIADLEQRMAGMEDKKGK